MAAALSQPSKKKFSFPTAFTILFILLVLIARATWIILAGSYDYNEKVKKDPTKSLIYDQKAETEKQFMSGGAEGTGYGKFTGPHKVILVLFTLAFSVMVYGVIPWEDLGLATPRGGGSRK